MPPKAPVSALPATPPRTSLLSSAVVVNERDRWTAGFSYEPEACGEDATGAVDPCTVHSKALTPPTSGGSVDVEPFQIWAGDSCSALSHAARDFKARAQRKLAACESNLIENELWRGDIARASGWSNKYLAHQDSDVLSDAPLTPINALACLEQALAQCNCGGRGMIHAMPQIVTLWTHEGMLRREGNLILTINDTIVVPGSGYDGSGPQGAVDGDPIPATDGEIWAYATGMVHIRLDPPVVIPQTHDEALNRSTNTLAFRAERIVAATWDCCHFAVSINADLCDIGGAGS